MLIAENNIMLFEARKARHKPHIILQILIFILVLLTANVASGIIIGIPLGIAMFKDVSSPILTNGDVTAFTSSMLDIKKSLPEWFAVASLFATVITTMCAIVYCRNIEGRSIASMGMRRKGFFKNYGIGYIIGIVMIGATVVLSVLLGGAEFTGLSSGVSVFYIALFFFGYLVQGMSEEVCVRGYFMVSCANKVSVVSAVILSSAVFAALHLANPGITALAFINLMLFGVFAAVYILRTEDLWGACAIHSAWNFFQGNIFGISVSGGAKDSSVFGTLFVNGRELISGGSFGIEGGICATIVLAAGIAVTLYLPQKTRPVLPKEEPIDVMENLYRHTLPVYKKK